MQEIYFDNAATTPVDQRLITPLNDLLENQYYNADSLYESAFTVKKQLEKSRREIAEILSCKSEEIIFTSGASEGNNMIIRGLTDFYKQRPKHLITTTIEHSSVKEVFDYLENSGWRVDRIKVDKNGDFDFEYFKKVLNQDTLLVSVMAVNNETGTILPVNKIAEYTKQHSSAFMHSDMTQALAKIPVSLSSIDFASFSAHKFGGFKGSGFIYKKEKTNLTPLILGGQQEFNQRAGTSNTPYQILLPTALKYAMEAKPVKELNLRLIKGLEEIPGIIINSQQASDYIVNFSLPGLSSQVAINALSKRQIMISGQATCASKKQDYSLVLKNMGFSETECRNSIRVSFWHQNTISQVEEFLFNLKEVIVQYAL